MGPSELRMLVGHEVDHLRVQLHRIDPRRPVVKRKEHLLSSTRTEDQRLGLRDEVVGGGSGG
jgi:hypothetical protein